MSELFGPGRRFSCAALTLLCLSLAGCAPGRTSQGFVSSRLTQAYIPLFQGRALIYGRWGAAVALTANIAVTNDHNYNLIPRDSLIARSRDYDLLFFREDGQLAPELGVPWYDFRVVAGEEGALPTSIGFSILTPFGLEELARADTVVIPAWHDIAREKPMRGRDSPADPWLTPPQVQWSASPSVIGMNRTAKYGECSPMISRLCSTKCAASSTTTESKILFESSANC